MRTATSLLALALWAAALAAGAADAMVPDLFDPGQARRPRIGEWLEYRICHPVDPLENSLLPSPLPAPDAKEGNPAADAPDRADAAGDDDSDADDYLFIEPSFEPPTAWRETPLRLEVTQVDDAGCRATMLLGGMRREVTLPFRRTAADGGGFAYESPQPADERRNVVLGDDEYDCVLQRRDSGTYGFARLSHPDVPFGLVRFATRDIDVILVGFGGGLPSDFPLRLRQRPDPAPGLFHQPD